MNREFLLQYVYRINPFFKEEDIEELEMINEYDILIAFKNGRRYIYDTFINAYRLQYPEGTEITEDIELKHFKRNLQKMMSRRRMTQEQLADAVGTSQVMISRYMTGKCLPTALVLRKMSIALKCSIDDFFYRKY